MGDYKKRMDQAERKLFSQVGFFAQPAQTHGKFQSFKEFKKHLQRPPLNFNSDGVKDILNNKSKMYTNPNTYPKQSNSTSKLDNSFSVVHPTLLTNVDPSQFKTTLSPLKYPNLLPELIENMDVTKSACYNFKSFVSKRFHSVKDYNIDKQGKNIEKMKEMMQQNFIQRFIAKKLKDGQNIFKKYDPMDEKLNLKDADFQFEPTNAELERYREMQVSYLTNLKEVGIEIPQEKQKLYKILIEKNYNEHPLRDEKKKVNPIIKNILQKQISSTSANAKEQDKERKRMMIQAAKKFKIDNHARNIFKEDKDYLSELNQHIDNQIKYRNNPSLQRVDSFNAKQKKKVVIDSNYSSMKPTDRIDEFHPTVFPTDTSFLKTRNQFSSIDYSKQQTKGTLLQAQGKIRKSNTKLDLINVGKNQTSPTKQTHNQSILGTEHTTSMTNTNMNSNEKLKISPIKANEKMRISFNITPQLIQMKNGHYNISIISQTQPQQQPSNMNSINVRSQDTLDNFKHESRHFMNNFFKKSDINRNNSNVQLFKKPNVDAQFSFYLNQLSQNSLQNTTQEQRKSRNEIFIGTNRYMPNGTFSYKKFTDEDQLISNSSATDMFQMSQTAKEMENDLLKKVSHLTRELDNTTVKMGLIKSMDEIDLNIGQKILQTNIQQKLLQKIHEDMF